jgi:beta-lactamase class A
MGPYTISMMSKLGALALSAAFCSAAIVVDAQSPENDVRAAIASFPDLEAHARIGVFAKNLETGATFGLSPDEPVRTASTIKVGIMAATFAAVAEGKLHWTDPFIMHNGEKVGGAGILTEFDGFTRLSLRDLIHLMIVVSDNTATNLVLNRVSPDSVNFLMDRLSLHNTKSLRKILSDNSALKDPNGFSRAGRLPENARFGMGLSTPRELVQLLERIERGQVVNKAASTEMITILKRQQDRNGIPRRLGSVPVANKTGVLDHMRADVGIVYAPTGRIAMAIVCDEIPQIEWSADNPGYLLISRLAEILTGSLK